MTSTHGCSESAFLPETKKGAQNLEDILYSPSAQEGSSQHSKWLKACGFNCAAVFWGGGIRTKTEQACEESKLRSGDWNWTVWR